MPRQQDEVTIYTDGACTGNPGPGGYAAIIIHSEGQREIAKGFRLTTNNRMEMMAAIAALRELPERSKVHLYSDSQYLVNGMRQGWARRWKANGWRRSGNAPALNPDLWEELLRLSQEHDVQWHWIRGHADHAFNKRCDKLSTIHAEHHATDIDLVYENAIGRSQGHGEAK